MELSLSENIRKMRKERKLTQEKLAEALGVTVGDRVILCSDGLSNTLTDDEILSFAEQYPDPETLCRELMRCTLERGARDNVTVVVVSK